jgi:3-hydroxyisobutyrate dehydrogenase
VTVAERGGLDRHAFLEAAQGSAANSAILQLKGRPMFDHDFEPPTFKLEHMLKDLRHMVAEARELGVELRLGGLAERIYAEAVAAGHGQQDFAAVVTAAESHVP